MLLVMFFFMLRAEGNVVVEWDRVITRKRLRSQTDRDVVEWGYKMKGYGMNRGFGVCQRYGHGSTMCARGRVYRVFQV